MIPELVPQLVGNDGIRARGTAIAEPDGWAIEPKARATWQLLITGPISPSPPRPRPPDAGSV